jgi:hypothetical protein
MERPHPPILVGGHGPGVVDRVLACGDRWLAVHADDVIERATAMWARADRPISKMVMGVRPDPRWLEAYAEAGFSRVIPWVVTLCLGSIFTGVASVETTSGGGLDDGQL